MGAHEAHPLCFSSERIEPAAVTVFFWLNVYGALRNLASFGLSLSLLSLSLSVLELELSPQFSLVLPGSSLPSPCPLFGIQPPRSSCLAPSLPVYPPVPTNPCVCTRLDRARLQPPTTSFIGARPSERTGRRTCGGACQRCGARGVVLNWAGLRGR